jgi:hypothetical protein
MVSEDVIVSLTTSPGFANVDVAALVDAITAVSVGAGTVEVQSVVVGDPNNA